MNNQVYDTFTAQAGANALPQLSLPAAAQSTQQSAPPHGILGLMEYPYRIPWEWVLPAIAAGALIALLSYWIWKKFLRNQNDLGKFATPIDLIPSLESRLKTLAPQEPFSGKNAENFYYQLSMTFREILEICCQFPATDFTQKELKGPIGAIDFLTRREKEFILNFLGRSDLIKFAGAGTNKDEALDHKEHMIQVSQKLINHFRQSQLKISEKFHVEAPETSTKKNL